MKTFLCLFSLLVLGALAQSPSEIIQQCYTNIFDSTRGVVSVTAAALSPAPNGAEAFDGLSVALASAPFFNLTSAGCDDSGMSQSPPFFVCSGVGEIFGVADAAAEFILLIDESSGSAGIAVGMSLGHDWSPLAMTNVPWASSDFVNSLSYGDVAANATYATAQFSVAGQTFYPGLSVLLTNVMEFQGKSILGLEALSPTIASSEFDVGMNFAFVKDPATNKTHFDWPNCLAFLHFNTLVPLSNTDVVMNQLTATVTGFTVPPQVDVALVSTFTLTDQPVPIVVDLEGHWSSVASQLTLTGTMQGPWLHPFGATWLRLDTVTFTANIQVAQALLSMLSLDSTGQITFGSYVTSAEVTGQAGDNFHEMVLQATVSTQQIQLELVLEQLLGLPAGTDTCLKDLVVTQAYVQLTLSNYPFGAFVRGFNLKGVVAVSENSPLATLLAPISDQIPVLSMNLLFQVEVGATSIDDVVLVLNADLIRINSIYSFQSVYINLDARPASSLTVQFNADLYAALPHNPNAVIFGVTASWDSTTQIVTFTGGLKSPWVNPFGATWLSIGQASVSLVAKAGVPASLQSLEVDGQATFGFSSSPTTAVAFKLLAFNNFEAYTFTSSVVVTAGGLSDVVRAVSPRAGGLASDDMAFQKATVDLCITTDTYQQYFRGLTVNSVVSLQGDTAKLLTAILTPSSVFDLGLYIPIFDDPLQGAYIVLQTPSIPIKPNIAFAGVQLSVQLGTPLTISLATGLTVKFKSNPEPITFVVGGAWHSDGTISIEGGMVGMWEDLFGLKGLDLGDAWVDVDLAPVTPYLVGLGIGGNLTIGAVDISLNGHVDIEDPTEIFFMTDIEQLSLLNLALAFNQWDSHFHINTSAIPDLFDIYTAVLKFAPEDGVILIDGIQVQFTKGFDLDATANILSLGTVHIHIHTPSNSSTILPDLIMDFDCSFGKDVDAQYRAFMSSIFTGKEFQPTDMQTGKAVGSYIDDVSWIIPTIRQIDIDDLSFQGLARGILPAITIQVEAFGKMYTWSKQLDLAYLLWRLEALIMHGIIDLKQLLSQPTCVINADCPTGQQCSHVGTTWGCVPQCIPELGVVDVFGCVPCKTDAECVNSEGGACCEDGYCIWDAGRYCGMCYSWLAPEQMCGGDPYAGCEFDFCMRCWDDIDCTWFGAAGWFCVDGECTDDWVN